MEHERQRLLQRKIFEDQMRALEHKQAQELLSLPFDPNSANGIQHIAVSAPTTPPRVNISLNGDAAHGFRSARQTPIDAERLSQAVGTAAVDKRKSVTYAPSVTLSPDLVTPGGANGFARPAGAKSMPASRRTSASEHDEELASQLQGLAFSVERSMRASPSPAPVTASILTKGSNRYQDDEAAAARYVYNAGMLLDEQLDQEMQHAMLNLPTSDDDKFHGHFPPKISTSSAALDLAHISQTSPHPSFPTRSAEAREKPSEWPQFSSPRLPDSMSPRTDRRNVTNPSLPHVSSPRDLHSPNGLSPALSKLAPGTVSASATPLLAQHAGQGVGSHHPGSRRGSPPSLLDTRSTTRSVPATPLGIANSIPHILKTPGTPRTPDNQGQSMSARISSSNSGILGDNALGASELQASLSRLSGQYEEYSDEQFGTDPMYGLGRGADRNTTGSGKTGSTALYHHNGTRYGLGIAGRSPANGADSKMNGLHGPKHKRGDIDLNRFAGTRLEDLQGEIATLCKDQHGCRYLQKKLEEGNPEHRDMIFRETFGHFAELMTDPFGNYLCQKLLEFSTDEQRNIICESVAQDLVNISLNMHGTRAVQKMIDFLSAQRQASISFPRGARAVASDLTYGGSGAQTDQRYNAQIHSIIVALSLHVVVLIKDLNGNHVIQKCLNKLAPEDNQFIYNAVAANCVEVATHRHGCCVLQRCIDHASEAQRVQLVNEITYNALTLVQDPYGNYVVQYILDLNDNRFSDAVIRQFAGNVCALSVQKFSSNVIEKCVRVAEHSTRKMLIEEFLNRSRLEKLLRDSYGNYCVQTALDYAEPNQRAALVEGIRPVLPLIRNTPYGKRIQNKLQREQMDHFNGNFHGHHAATLMGVNSPVMSVNSPVMGGLPAGRHMPRGMPHRGPVAAEVYSTQGVNGHGMYAMQQGQGAYSPVHLTPQIPHLQPQAMDPYGMSPFAGAGLVADPYQASSFGYGM
ncbi:hypothetical protein HGRIS_007391 [Hohenbuehelia grisea]